MRRQSNTLVSSNISGAQILDEQQREKFKQKLKAGKANDLAMLIEHICAVWGFVFKDETRDTAPLFIRENFANAFSELCPPICAVVLALHNWNYTVANDYPLLLQQLPGAIGAGFERGSQYDYVPQADIELIALSKAGVVILNSLIEGRFCKLSDDKVRDLQYDDIYLRLTNYQRQRAFLVSLLLSANLGFVDKINLGMADALLTMAKKKFYYGGAHKAIEDCQAYEKDIRKKLMSNELALYNHRYATSPQKKFGGVKISEQALDTMEKSVAEIRDIQYRDATMQDSQQQEDPHSGAFLSDSEMRNIANYLTALFVDPLKESAK